MIFGYDDRNNSSEMISALNWEFAKLSRLNSLNWTKFYNFETLFETLWTTSYFQHYIQLSKIVGWDFIQYELNCWNLIVVSLPRFMYFIRVELNKIKPWAFKCLDPLR